MPNPSDFERLLKQGQKRTDADNAIVEKRLAQMYRQSYKQAEDELAALYARLGGKLDLAEARKYKRLGNVLASISAEHQKLTGKTLTMAIDTSAQNYTEAFYSYQWAMNQATGIALTWGILPVDAIRASVFSEYSGLNLIKTLHKNAAQDLSRIQAAITRGIATGTSYARTADSMKGAFNKGYSDAIRVVRTEAGRNFTEGHLKAHDDAIDLGIDVVKVWDASLDQRTRPAHGALDGVEADSEGNFSSSLGGKGPGPHLMQNASDDIQCRCILVDQIRGMPPELRRIRGEGVQPYQKFTDWAESKGWTREKGWPKVVDSKVTKAPTKMAQVKAPASKIPSSEVRNRINSIDRTEYEQLEMAYNNAYEEGQAAYQNWASSQGSERQKLRQEATRLLIKSKEALNAFDKAAKKYKKKIFDALSVEASERFVGDIVDMGSYSVKDSIKNGGEFITRITKSDRLRKTKVKIGGDNIREYFESKSMVVYLTKNSGTRTVVHELAHTLEFNSKKISKKSKAFLKKRAGSENPIKLKDKNQEFHESEIAYEDEFEKRGGNAYSGKIYDDSPATELVSMGVERLYADAAKFAMDDPEYFDFVIDILQGDL